MRGLHEDTFKAARLDRALCNLVWRERFSGVLVHHLPRVKSDHASLLIKLNEGVECPKMKAFKF